MDIREVLKQKRKNKKKAIGIALLSVAMVSTTLVSMKLADFSMLKTFRNTFQVGKREVLYETQKKDNTDEEQLKKLSSSYLNGIYIGESLIQGFTPYKLNYEILLNKKPEKIVIAVDKQDEGQIVTGIDEVILTGEEQKIEIAVTSSDGKNTSKYSITIKYSQINASKENVTNVYKFEQKNESQEFIAPYTGYYFIECWGAQGGSYSGIGGKGAYTSGNLYLTKGQKLYVYVGETGGNQYAATFNGGGIGANQYRERAGGGATDIRLTQGEWNDFNSLKSRIMVAAGGGGSVGPSYSCNGGAGGELNGLNGSYGGGGSYTVSGGGTQIAPGRAGTGAASALPAGFGFGGSRNANHGGGGRRWLLWWWPEDAIITAL